MPLTNDDILEFVGQLFPEEVGSISNYYLGFDRKPIYHDHVDLICEISKVEDLSKQQKKLLGICHTTLSAFYIYIDKVIDHEKEYLSSLTNHVLTFVFTGSLNSLSYTQGKYGFEYLYQICCGYISKNLKAIESFELLRKNFESRIIDYDSIVIDRSNTVLMLFELISLLSEKKVEQDMKGILSKYLVVSQRGDDFSDWRNDFNKRQWTPFLKKIRESVSEVELTEASFERTIYLEGYYEWECSKILTSLKELDSDLIKKEVSDSSILRKVIRKEIDEFSSRLENFIQFKIDSIS